MQSRNLNLLLCPFCFLDKIDSPFCLQNCFFLLAAHFAQILLSKFCQGLVTMQRFKFNSHSQKESKSVSEFVAELHGLSEHCNFQTTLDDMLRYPLVCGIKKMRVQWRLLAEFGPWDLSYKY